MSHIPPADTRIVDGPDGGQTIVLAHGAGAPMDHPWMQTVAAGLAQQGLRVVRFEFPYMAERRRSGKRRGPNAPRVLLERWAEVIEGLGDANRLVIGGKSMGGRIASMAADAAGVAGLVCLGYPFHPLGKPEQLRTEHLAGLKTPALILQGERDRMGSRVEVAGYTLSRTIELQWLPDGDHSFRPRKLSGRTESQNISDAVAAVAAFVARLQGRAP